VRMCKELQNGNDEQSCRRMLHFLKHTIPNEIQRAQDNLSAFDACTRVLQVDLAFQRGEIVRIGKHDAERAREQWRAHHTTLQQEVRRARSLRVTSPADGWEQDTLLARQRSRSSEWRAALV